MLLPLFIKSLSQIINLILNLISNSLECINAFELFSQLINLLHLLLNLFLISLLLILNFLLYMKSYLFHFRISQIWITLLEFHLRQNLLESSNSLDLVLLIFFEFIYLLDLFVDHNFLSKN